MLSGAEVPPDACVDAGEVGVDRGAANVAHASRDVSHLGSSVWTRCMVLLPDLPYSSYMSFVLVDILDNLPAEPNYP